MFKFIHAGDIHLDSSLLGLQRYDGAPTERLLGATRQAFKNLVDLAIDEHVSFVLIAGDLYDGDWKDHNTGLFLVAQMAQLREAEIPVFIIKGNHDAASQITKSLRMPDNVKMFSDTQPESIELGNCGVAIHGQGFTSRAVLSNLATTYPRPLSGLFNIGLLHTSLNGREGHEAYAPCSLHDLVSKQYDYWALGHVHRREIVHDNPWIVFCGNIQGRHVRETGPKGCTLVSVQDGKVLAAEHRDLGVLRWSVCGTDVAGATTGDEVLDIVENSLAQEFVKLEGRPSAMRLHITGCCRAHRVLCAFPDKWTNEIRAIATTLSNGEMWIEKVELQTTSEARADEVLREGDALSGLLRAIQALDLDDQSTEELFDGFSDVQMKLPAELRSEPSLDFRNPMNRHKIIEDVKQLILSRLFDERR